jgi:UDP-N-acetylmuramyl pentapeptide synthase
MGGTWFETVPELLEALPSLIRPQDTVLVKASHAMGFETVVAALEQLHL